MSVTHHPELIVYKKPKVEKFPQPEHRHVYIPEAMHGWKVEQASPVKAVATSLLYGKTTHFQVYYDHHLGTDGPVIADAVLKSCEDDYTRLQEYFGGVTPASLPFKIRLTTDSRGASHATCAATTINIGCNSGPRGDLGFIRSLVIAEEDEVFEATINNGWDCGASNGEGLSRVLANDIVPGVEPPGFISASVWLNSDREDFVNNTLPTDTDYPSIGCSVLFLNWLRFERGYSWQEIISKGGTTLAETYKNLTGNNDGWQQFSKVINDNYPTGTPVNLGTDNPFPIPA